MNKHKKKGIDLSKYTAKQWAEATGTNYTPTNTVADTGITSFTAESNNKSIDEVSNNASRQYKFVLNGETQYIKAHADESLKTLGAGLIQSTDLMGIKQKDNIVNDAKSMKAGTFMHYKIKGGEEIIVYKTGASKDQYVILLRV